MKALRLATLILFGLICLVPLFFFNFTPDAISEIDNRKLAERALVEEGDRTAGFESYLNDRIGFRDEMISAFTVLNDRIFGKMVHPIYSYGKDGYVFGGGVTTGGDFGEYHLVFAEMVARVQAYCEERGVPFLFVFDPAKPAVYSDKLADGISYNREWVDEFFAELDRRGVNYLDNTETLRGARAAGVEVFNRKYDANHWNDLGAFYGTQKIQERLREFFPEQHVNQLYEFERSEELETTLPFSAFPIEEFVPILTAKSGVRALTEDYDGMAIDPSYPYFAYLANDERQSEGAGRVLMFQGSYMNGRGSKFMEQALGEYIAVHDYSNILNLPYYFNLFEPDCVVFEVAEYTLNSTYFNLEQMQELDFNPVLSLPEGGWMAAMAYDGVSLERHGALWRIFWETEEEPRYVWARVGGRTIDLLATEGGYAADIRADGLDFGTEIELYTEP